MNEIYIVDGQEYSVGQSRLEEFLQKFPNAVKKEEDVEQELVDSTVDPEGMGKTVDSALVDPIVESEDMESQQEVGSLELPKVTGRDIKVTEEVAIGRLRQRFGGMGFEFEEGGPGGSDYITVFAPPEYEGQPKEERKQDMFSFDKGILGTGIGLSTLFGSSVEEEADRINNFIQNHYQKGETGRNLNSNAYAETIKYSDTRPVSFKNEDGSDKKLEDLTSKELEQHQAQIAQEMMNNPNVLQPVLKDIQPELMSYVEEVKADYDMTKQSDVDKVNELIGAKYDELVNASPEYKKIQNGIGLAVMSKYGSEEDKKSIIGKQYVKEAEEEILPITAGVRKLENFIYGGDILGDLMGGVGRGYIQLLKGFNELSVVMPGNSWFIDEQAVATSIDLEKREREKTKNNPLPYFQEKNDEIQEKIASGKPLDETTKNLISFLEKAVDYDVETGFINEDKADSYALRNWYSQKRKKDEEKIDVTTTEDGLDFATAEVDFLANTVGGIDIKSLTDSELNEFQKALPPRVENIIKEQSAIISKSNEYQEQLSRLGQPEIFGEGILNPQITLDEFQQMIGTQAIQMIAGMFLIPTFAQESGGIAMESITIEAARKYAPDLDDEEAKQAFGMLPESARTRLMTEVVTNGEVDFEPALKGGAGAASLDLVSNFLVFTKGVKAIPKSVLRDVMRGRWKKLLLGKGAQGATVATGFEGITEVLQEKIGFESVEAATGYAGVKEENIRRMLEGGAQAVVTTPFLMGGGKVLSSAKKEFSARLFKNPREARFMINKKKAAIDEAFKNGKITIDERDDAFTYLESVEDMVNNTPKYKSLGKDAKQTTVNELYNVKILERENTQLEESNKKIKEEQVSGAGTVQALQNQNKINENKKKIQESESKVIKELLKANVFQDGRIVEWINTTQEGDFKGKTFKRFKDKDQAKKYFNRSFKNKNWLKDTESILNKIEEYKNKGENIDNATAKAFNDFKNIGDPKKLQKMLDMKRLHDGGVNAAVLGNTAWAIDQNIIDNIDKGDITSTNAFHHDAFHWIQDNMSTEKLKSVQESVVKELLTSADPKLLKIAVLANELFSRRYADKKLTDRQYYKEWFSNLSDAFKYYSVTDLNENSYATLSGVSKLFAKMFQKQTQMGLDWSKFDGGNALEYIQKFNKFQGVSTGPTFRMSKGKVNTELEDKKTEDKALASEVYTEINETFNEYVDMDKELAANVTADMMQGIVFDRLTKLKDAGLIEGFTNKDLEDIQLQFTGPRKSLPKSLQNRGAVGLLMKYDKDFEGGVMGYFNATIRDRKMLDMRLQEFVENHPKYGNVQVSMQEEGVARVVEAQQTPLSPEEIMIQKEERKKTPVEKKKIILSERLGVKDKVDKIVKKKLSKLNLEKLTFKTLKDQTPEITGNLFGISPKKLINLANITKGELQSAQMFINKNADLLIAMLPEGATVSGTATGVPNTLLKAFYTKTDRAKMTKTGSKAGLAIQQKNNIKKTDFLETFGIINGKPIRTDRNTSARVLALANLTGKMITNQAVRQQLANIDNSQEIIQNIKEGKSETMFSEVDQKMVEELGFEYNDPNTAIGSENYINWIANTDMFVNGFMNKTIAITSSTISKRELRKYSKEVLSDMKKFSRDPKFAKTKWNTKLVNETTDNQKQALNKRNIDNFDYMWMAIFDGLKKDPSQLPYVVNWLAGSINEGTHPHRLGAVLEYIDKTVKDKLYFEHALQNASAYRLLIKAAQNQNRKEFRKTLDALKNNYKLIAISKVDNKKIDTGGFKNVMSLDGSWDVFNNSWWERYFNQTIADLGGINPNNLIQIGSNKSAAEVLSVSAVGRISNLKSETNKITTLNKAVVNARVSSFSESPKGITVLDFDDTLATTKSLVKYTRPDGTTGTLNAEEYANTYEDLLNQGFTFDFSDFNKVVKGKIAPLFQKALKLQGKFGPENMFVLTARPPQAAKAIFDFLKANGLNIPIKNITGLANSTSEAKALWIVDKVGEGYNDFYFADDALQNVQAVKNMLNQFDVKSKVQQAKAQFSESLNDQFNNILEEVTGIESKKRFSDVKARKRGASKGKFRFFIPPSHEDFVGLLYNFMGKGKKGNAHRDFFEKALVQPLNRAYRELNTAKQSIANDYKSLNKQFPIVKKRLARKTPDGDFTYEDAVRVYLWDKHGYSVPGLSKTDQKELSEIVKSDPKLQQYAESINTISKQDAYISPTESWEAGDIRTDLDDATGRVGREEFFTEFFQNADIIFSEENFNKIEAAYGAGVVSALKDILYRTKTGRNRPSGQNKLVNQFMNYLNGSVASTMFFNIRSAVLQQMSLVNFINFADNNILSAAKAFANQKQYWADWAYIFNSDFMKQRRGGIKTDVNGAELAASVKGAKNPIQAAIKKLLEIGFLPTQIGDNIAIATGGSTFLRNRINTYLKQGLSKKEAESKAWTDFQILAEATQQSARPDMVSQQQASPLGKIILAFQNVTSQFNRLGKKAFLDIKNRRITPGNTTQLQSDMSNLSRIAYYFAIQNLVFYSLQSALFMAMFDEDEEDEKWLKKKERMINGSIDSVLRGTGVWGAAVSTLKNMAIKWHEQRDKGYNADESAVLMEMLNVSPPLGIKARKVVNAERTLNYNKKVIDEMDVFDIDNPQWSAVTNYIEATTNVPLNRLYNKTQNVRQSLDSQNSALERVLMFSGWSQWNLGIESQEIEDIKEKEKKKKKKQTFGRPTFERKTYKRKTITR